MVAFNKSVSSLPSLSPSHQARARKGQASPTRLARGSARRTLRPLLAGMDRGGRGRRDASRCGTRAKPGLVAPLHAQQGPVAPQRAEEGLVAPRALCAMACPPTHE
ncbi:hypothetical protein H6P81_015924 [Aristolochia fimbriata]|uniref:Uncharacterized protein n=1 Tax=Aristolochia fimbriata TaxID=158543 RepID=A0AAV7E7I5_ARIFI|nr:hypothetical protein H6P81_015924 [Aristolochia fimbriata]